MDGYWLMSLTKEELLIDGEDATTASRYLKRSFGSQQGKSTVDQLVDGMQVTAHVLRGVWVAETVVCEIKRTATLWVGETNRGRNRWRKRGKMGKEGAVNRFRVFAHHVNVVIKTFDSAQTVFFFFSRQYSESLKA